MALGNAVEVLMSGPGWERRRAGASGAFCCLEMSRCVDLEILEGPNWPLGKSLDVT